MTKTGKKVSEIRQLFSEEEKDLVIKYQVNDNGKIYLAFIGDIEP